MEFKLWTGKHTAAMYRAKEFGSDEPAADGSTDCPNCRGQVSGLLLVMTIVAAWYVRDMQQRASGPIATMGHTSS